MFASGKLEKDSVTEKISATESDGKNYPSGSKLYFINTAEWEHVYAYVWKERGISSGVRGVDLGVFPWPGKPATYEGTFRGYSVYSYEIDGLDVNSIIFSESGGYQTEDLEIVYIGILDA